MTESLSLLTDHQHTVVALAAAMNDFGQDLGDLAAIAVSVTFPFNNEKGVGYKGMCSPSPLCLRQHFVSRILEYDGCRNPLAGAARAKRRYVCHFQ
jgi:hypothetical protein